MYFDFKITPPGYPSKGIMFVNHQANNRSGHLSHALVEYKKGHVMAFYSNCSAKRNKYFPGHNGFGWLEYKKSSDYGETWSEPKILDYSYYCLLNEPFTISCEKAVSTKEDEIICLCIRNENPNGWEPYLSPIVIKSTDGGETWSEPKEMCPTKGRIYDAIVVNGVIYVFMLANDDWECRRPEDKYHIYESKDGGETFTLRSVLPFETLHHAYGSMSFTNDGKLICYEYNTKDEYNLVYHISDDMGLTWCESGLSYCKKRIRNPQVAKVKSGYILHGRSGCVIKDLPMDFVLYTSKDGINWDEGTILYRDEGGATAYYSNNLVMELPSGKERVLIQSSVPYSSGCVNIVHYILDFD